MSRFPINPKWHLYYSDEVVDVYVNEKENCHIKIKIDGVKSKQFYRETAHSDVQRYLVDETGMLKYWSLFS
jgi:hypothetical protein